MLISLLFCWALKNKENKVMTFDWQWKKCFLTFAFSYSLLYYCQKYQELLHQQSYSLVVPLPLGLIFFYPKMIKTTFCRHRYWYVWEYGKIQQNGIIGFSTAYFWCRQKLKIGSHSLLRAHLKVFYSFGYSHIQNQ